jgi:hypothetical protein
MTADSVCPVCGLGPGGPGPHPAAIRMSDLGTERDCGWVIRVRKAESMVVRLFSAGGMEPGSVSGDVVRACALELMSKYVLRDLEGI